MKKKIRLETLKVQSFVTEMADEKKQTVNGGSNYVGCNPRFTKVGCTLKRTDCISRPVNVRTQVNCEL